MNIQYVVNTVFRSCTYIITQDDVTWLVDCGDVDKIIPLIVGRLGGVMLTHSHFDHIYGLNQLEERFPGTPIYTNEDGKQGLLSDKLNLSRYHEDPFVLDCPDCIRTLDDRQCLSLFEGISAQAVYTPGHSPCCVSWVLDDAVFTGDSFIPGVKTVTLFPHADKRLAMQSELLVRQLARSRTIYPGHEPESNQSFQMI